MQMLLYEVSLFEYKFFLKEILLKFFLHYNVTDFAYNSYSCTFVYAFITTTLHNIV
jgi:hypothetical protein